MTYTATYTNNYGKVKLLRELDERLWSLEHSWIPPGEYIEARVQTYLVGGVSPEELEEAIRDHE